jgi:Ca2+-binding RTX toxin-like protein
MAVINFSALNNGDKISLGGDTLVFDGGIDAADVSIGQVKAGVTLSVGGITIILKDWVIGNLNSAQIMFGNGSELLVGNTLFGLGGDNNANLLAPFFLGDDNHDQIRGMGGDDDMSGGEGNDLIFGQGGDDTLNGDGDDDTLNGGIGDDKIFGGEGNDTIRIDDADTGHDKVKGGTGDDEILYSNASRAAKLRLDGEAGNDTVHGGRGDDKLFGGDDIDTVFGFGGDDHIEGGNGADTLDGMAGKDTYLIKATESPPAADGFDTVKFVAADDTFDLDLAGTKQNYIEEDFSTADFAAALAKATAVLIQQEGLKDYVFLYGADGGWLFGEYTGDNTPDIAIRIENGFAEDHLDFKDII